MRGTHCSGTGANARQAGNFVLKHRDEIEYMDVSPKQLGLGGGQSDSVP
jgi:hypothetical protein